MKNVGQSHQPRRFTPDDETFFNTTLSVLREARSFSAPGKRLTESPRKGRKGLETKYLGGTRSHSRVVPSEMLCHVKFACGVACATGFGK